MGTEAPGGTGRLGWDDDEKSTLHTHALTLSIVGKPKMGGFVLFFEYTSPDLPVLDIYPL